jgi:hypothetical protein
LTKDARLKSKRIQRIQIEDDLLKRKKKLFLKMLFDREAALSQYLFDKKSIRSEVTHFLKNRTVSHKA